MITSTSLISKNGVRLTSLERLRGVLDPNEDALEGDVDVSVTLRTTLSDISYLVKVVLVFCMILCIFLVKGTVTTLSRSG